jgi:hypothetical protein
VSPIVAISRMMSGWLTSGRITKRSTASARSPITPMVRISARIGRHPFFVQADQRQPGKHHHDALAKLNTPDALKISTKPSAISA